MTNTTRSAHSYSDREETHVPTREECGEIVFQQIRSLMEDGRSQTLTREPVSYTHLTLPTKRIV